MKKILSMLLVFAMMFGFLACGAFHLKNALGLALGEHGEGLRIIVRRPVNSEIRLQQLDLLFRVLDHRQVPQSQKVHFQQTQLLDGGHGVLGDNGIVVFA